jgi:cell division septum initiation protein DivIVA
MDYELALLERKLSTLIAHAKALREANEELRRELADAQQQNRALLQRMQAAGSRLDAVLARIPEE